MTRKILAAMIAAVTLSLAAPSLSEAANTKPAKVQQKGPRAKATMYVVYFKNGYSVQRYGIYGSRQQAQAVVRSLGARRVVAWMQPEVVVR